jgi:membrane protein DedA with SNARE-associated domain
MIDTAQLIDKLPYPGLFLALMLGSIGLPIPEEATLLLCGYLIAKAVIQPVPGIAVVYAGVICSDFVVFMLGRHYGRKLLRFRIFKRILSPDRLINLENRFTRFAPLLIIFGRHIFGFRTKIVFMSALMGMTPRKFLLLDSIAATISVSVMVFAGYKGAEWVNNLFSGLSTEDIILLVSGGLILVLIICFIYLRCRSKHDDETICPNSKAESI